ncbi:hypothetical protein KY320_01280 [Candidatus Woesearchaeota archaeon]|nr:hypothetical protein [Candidatus Woesearchaeota archaeon]
MAYSKRAIIKVLKDMNSNERFLRFAKSFDIEYIEINLGKEKHTLRLKDKFYLVNCRTRESLKITGKQFEKVMEALLERDYVNAVANALPCLSTRQKLNGLRKCMFTSEGRYYLKKFSALV